MYCKQQANGNWTAIVQVDGCRKKVTRPTKREVEREAARLTIELGGQLAPTDITVRMIIEEYREAHPEWSPVYAADMARIASEMPDHFLDRNLGRVDAAVILELYRALTAKGLSAHRVRRAHELLRPAWKLAMRHHRKVVDESPIDDVDPPKIPKAKVRPPQIADVGRLFDAVKGTDFEIFQMLAAVTGARRGEIVALQWCDFNDDDNSLVIRRSLVWTSTPDGDDADAIAGTTWETGLVVRNTKTDAKGHRVVALPAPLADMLRALRVRQVTMSLAAGFGDPVWMFSHTAGRTPWTPDYATHRFVDLCKDLGIDGVRLHDLRHFMATQLLAAGEAISTVSHRLGHSNVTVTLGTYSHYVKAADQAAAETMGRILQRGN